MFHLASESLPELLVGDFFHPPAVQRVILHDGHELDVALVVAEVNWHVSSATYPTLLVWIITVDKGAETSLCLVVKYDYWCEPEADGDWCECGIFRAENERTSLTVDTVGTNYHIEDLRGVVGKVKSIGAVRVS